ncbi:MAG TPA: protein kinase [Terriglobales bacterium]|nr:protein kinase [Terriglobales bacterium]
MIGTEIASYRILEKLGQGGMGVVYKAVDTGLDRMVAMKVLNPDLSRNPELVERFRAEAKAQANLNHTNLATLYAFMVHQGTAMMVMEFVEGETFAQMIRRRGPIPEVEAVPLFRQALLGIGYAHRAGILHRDIKPSNLMLNKNGLVKVMDFGIAKVMGARGMTRTGTQLGTLAYMSPEQIQNRNVDIRSDIYELGITLYEMLTGHLPFESDSEFQIMQDHVYTPPPAPSKYDPYINKGIENVILKSIEKNPEDRFQTVEQFGSALEHPEALSYTPRVAPADAPTATFGGTGSGSHPHLSVSAVPPPRSSSGAPAVSPAAPSAPASVATPVPLPLEVPSVPAVPGMAPTRISASSVVPGPIHAPAPTLAPPQREKAGSPTSKKPLLIAGIAAVLLLVVGVAAYQILVFAPHTSGGVPTGPAPAQAVTPDASPTSQATHTIDEAPPAENSSSTTPPTPAPTPKPERASRQPSQQHAKPSEPAPDQGQQMYQKAQAAFSQGHYFEPVNDSALHWAILARQAGNPAGKALEEQIVSVYKTRVAEYYNSGNYQAALALVNEMLKFYPGNASLLAQQKKFQSALSNSKR